MVIRVFSLVFTLLRIGRFANLVDSPEKSKSFKAKYGIPPDVSIEHYEVGEQYMKRPTRAVAIPMIEFIEGGMRIPIDKVMRDFLLFFRICPTQCSPNLFKVVNSVAWLNKKMGINLTHRNINWVYNCHDSFGSKYYLQTRFPPIRLISCLPKTNKCLNEDYLIISGNWHDGLHCPVRDGALGGGKESKGVIFLL